MSKLMQFNDFVHTVSEGINEMMLDEAFVSKYSDFSVLMEKVNIYNKRQMVLMNHGVSESFIKNHKINGLDILLTESDKQAANVMFEEFISHLTESMNNEITQLSQVMEEGVIPTGSILEESWISDKIDKLKGSYAKSKETVMQKADDVKQWAGEKIEQVKEEYGTVIDFIKKLIESGVETVKDLMAKVGEIFVKLSDTLSGALKKLGAFNEEDGEQAPEIDSAYTEGVDDKEKGFMGHIVAYINMMMGNKKAEKLMEESVEFAFDFDDATLNEGKLMDKIANNKAMQFIFGYGKDKKISWWKSLLISIVGSLIVSIALPLFLQFAGVGAVAGAVICTAVSSIWQCKGIIKILLNRYVNRKPGEKFFNLSTTLALVMCILPFALMRIPAVKEFMQSAFQKLLELTHIDDGINAVQKAFFGLMEKIGYKHPNLKEQVEHIVRVVDDVKTKAAEAADKFALKNVFGKDNGLKPKSDSVEAYNDIRNQEIDKWAGDKADSLKELCDEVGKSKGTSGFYNTLNDKSCDIADADVVFIPVDTYNSANAAVRGVLDSAKGSGLGVTLTNKSYITSGGHHGVASGFFVRKSDLGDFSMDDLPKGVVSKIIPLKLASKPPLTVIEDIIHHSWDNPVKFNPVFIPWLDAKPGEYSLSFGPNTRGLHRYAILDIDTKKLSEAEKDLAKDARKNSLEKMKKLMKATTEKRKGLLAAMEEKIKKENDEKSLKEFKSFKKDEEKKIAESEKIEDRKVICFYVSNKRVKKDSTGVDGEKVLGVIIDPETMLCCDVPSEKIMPRERKNPYFLKGLFSKLQFVPTEKEDNHLKSIIRDMLGKTFDTACKSCLNDGIGKFFVNYDEKEEKYVSAYEDEHEVFELGNLTAQEYCEILNDGGKDNNKTAFGYMSGKFGSNIKVSEKGGKLSFVANKDNDTIENKKFRLVKKGEKYTKKKKGEDGKFTSVEAVADKDTFVLVKKGEKVEGETFDFVDAKILPRLADKESQIYHDLHEDENIKKLFYKGDEADELNMEFFTDEDLNIKRFLFRPETTFSKKDEHNLQDAIEKFLEKKSGEKESKEEEESRIRKAFKKIGASIKGVFGSKDELYEAIKKAVEMIWEDLDSKVYKKYVKKTNESVLFESDEDEMTVYEMMLAESGIYDEEPETKKLMTFEDFVRDL